MGELHKVGAAQELLEPLLLGAQQTSVNFAGVQVNVLPAGAFVLLPVATDSRGQASLPIPIPNIPSLGGGVLQAQFLVVDPLAPNELAGTRGLSFEVFPRC